MKLTDTLRQRKTLSFEVFPPKDDRPLSPVLQATERLMAFSPDFISCTYGAGGTNQGQQAAVLQHITGLDTCAMANYTCLNTTADSARRLAGEYTASGVRAFLALRGDIPAGQQGTGGDFRYGCELLGFLRPLVPDAVLAAGCYPEQHPDSLDFRQDLDIMRRKQDLGTDFFITQLCHDTDAALRFLDAASAAGVTLPVVFGLMPVLSVTPTLRMCFANGSSVPRELSALITRYGNDSESFRAAGKAYTVRNLERLRGSGYAGFHVFTLNNAADTADILTAAGYTPAAPFRA